MRALTRRRAITLLAASAAASRGFAATPPFEWHGSLMGAAVRIVIDHEDKAMAAAVAEEVVGEARRLEGIFSLYRMETAVSRLNAQGVLIAPPAELVALLRRVDWANKATDGAFDPTIQPLFELYARHFSTPDPDRAGPGADRLDKARALVGWGQVLVSDDRIAFARPGMKITLNGIAQGFMTDVAADRLRRAGLRHCLVDLGEQRAIGPRPGGMPWRVGIADPQQSGVVIERFDLASGAVATTSPFGFSFDPEGRFSHILAPHVDRFSPAFSTLTVRAGDATTADALSTGLSVMQPEQVRQFLGEHPNINVIAKLMDGAGFRA